MCKRIVTSCSAHGVVHPQYVLRHLFVEIYVTIKWGTTFLSSTIYHDSKHNVRYMQHTQCIARLSCDWLIKEYTRNRYCNMLFAFSACNSGDGTDAQDSVYIILVNITQTLTCSIMATSPRDMKCNILGTCEYMLLTDCIYISQWRWHHCSCKARGIEKHMCNRMTNGSIQTKGPRNTTRGSTGSIPWLTELTIVARRLPCIPIECFDLDILCHFTVTDILKTNYLMTFVA